MKGIIISNARRETKQTNRDYLLNLLFSPFKAGLVGFSSFFTILLIAKYAGAIFGSVNNFKIQAEDVFLSLIGFTLLFIVKLLENLGKKNKEKA